VVGADFDYAPVIELIQAYQPVAGGGHRTVVRDRRYGTGCFNTTPIWIVK
jgi:hypothetical protein